MPQDKSLRDRVKAADEKLAGLRAQRAEAAKERESAKAAFASAEEEPGSNGPAFQAAEEAVRKVSALDEQISGVEREIASLGMMMGPDGPAQRGPEDSAEAGGSRAAQLLAESETYQRLAESGAFESRSHLGRHYLGRLADREDVAAMLSSAEVMAATTTTSGKTGAIPADRRGIVPPLLQRFSLLDLFPSGTTDSNVVEYVQVTEIPTGAKETAEDAEKAEETLKTKDAQAPVRTIAGYNKITRQALSDVAGLQTLINTLLPYSVRKRLEGQIIAGKGEGVEITGLTKTSGIGAPEAVAYDNLADAILRAITTVVVANGEPNFVALNPLDWQTLLLMRESEKAVEGDEEKEIAEGVERSGFYLYGSPGSLAAPTIWGLRIVTSPSIPAGKPLVGDASGATVMYREGLQILVSDSDGTDFTENRVTVLAEVRAAFPVWNPAKFAVATLA